MPGWFFLISGLICGVLAFWLLTWQRRIRRGAIATGIQLSGALLTVKPGELAGRWPSAAVLSPRLVVRYTWQGTGQGGRGRIKNEPAGEGVPPRSDS